MNFSERLQFAMDNKVIDGVKGVTAYRIGKETSISKQSVLGYIDNGVKPNHKVIIELADYLGINVDWLMTGNGEMYRDGENNTHPILENNIEEIHIVKQKSITKTTHRVMLYNATTTLGLVSIYDNSNKEIVGELQIPFLPKSDAAVFARGDSMYPLIKSGAVVAFRKLNSLDFFLSGEIYIVDYEIDGDIYTVTKYVKRIDGDDEHVSLECYNNNHAPQLIPKKSIRVLALVTAWVNFQTM